MGHDDDDDALVVGDSNSENVKGYLESAARPACVKTGEVIARRTDVDCNRNYRND